MFVFFIRPDLSFAVQQACQFIGDPTQNHLQASKRILRYIKGTLHYGLAFTLGFPSLSAYCDMLTGQVIQLILGLFLALLFSLAIVLSLGQLRSNQQFLDPPLKLNIGHWHFCC